MANTIFSWDEEELKEASSDALQFSPEQLHAMALRYLKALIFQHEAIECYYLVNMVTGENCEFIGVYRLCGGSTNPFKPTRHSRKRLLRV